MSDLSRLTPRLLLTLTVLLLILLGLGSWLDQFGQRGYEIAWAKTLTAFGVAKALNAVLSVVQESQVQASMIFASGTIAIGQLVSPLNHVMEALSNVLLAALMSLFIQKILLGVGQWWGVQVLLAVSGGLFILGLWHPGLRRLAWRRLFARLLMAALLLRFCIPVTAAVNDLASSAILDAYYSESLQESQRIGQAAEMEEELRALTGEAPGAKQLAGFWSRMRDMIGALDTLAEHSVRLMTVFILQTMVFPLIFLGGLLLLVRWALRGLTAESGS